MTASTISQLYLVQLHPAQLIPAQFYPPTVLECLLYGPIEQQQNYHSLAYSIGQLMTHTHTCRISTIVVEESALLTESTN